MPNAYTEYRRGLVCRFRRYKDETFSGDDELFDYSIPKPDRPPVFRKDRTSRNIITPEGLDPSVVGAIHRMIPPAKRHRWFRSMASSQALTQGVFGTLSVLGKEWLLERLKTDEGESPFVAGHNGRPSIDLEVEVRHLGEPRRTSLDVSFRGARHVGIEVKFSEQKVGDCSRPRLKPDDPQYCDGNYSRRPGHRCRCPLTEIKVRYWKYLPKLFIIDPGIDHSPCPLDETYQLVRNLLGVCVLPDGSLTPDGRVVLLYDGRNPAFQRGGQGDRAYAKIREALRESNRLQRCSWQNLAGILRADAELRSLAEQLDRKYGI